MNNKQNSLNILKQMVSSGDVVGIKTSFEDEGALFNDIVMLKNICSQAKTDLILKIGGPEAIRDIKESYTLGVSGIVAPMVESVFGLEKFIQASKYNADTELYINIETKTGVLNFDEIYNSNLIKKLSGITIGRVDLVSSMGKDRSYVDSEEVFDITKNIFKKVKDIGLKACLGGAVSIKSKDFLNNLYNEKLLDKFETRYVIFDPSVSLNNLEESLEAGQKFEYEWLLHKKNFYSKIESENDNRINMIKERIIDSSGNKI